MLLDLASYFSEHPQKYSVAFIAFGGEELGLLGSLNYVKKPLIPLTKTRFVFNMDLMGDGSKEQQLLMARYINRILIN